MKKPDPLHDLKEPMHCPVCEFVIACIGDVQNPQPVKKGNIVICAGCGNVLEVGDSNLIKMTKETAATLDNQTKALIQTLVARQLQENMKNERN